MEAVFLACFIFGALFTVTSVLVGAVGNAFGGESGTAISHHDPAGGWQPGHGGAGIDLAGHADTGGAIQHPAHLDAAALGGSGGQVDTGAALTGHPPAGHGGHHGGLPLFNVSTGLAFLTWFGAAGYLLTAFAGWALVPVLVAALVAGSAGAFVIAKFLSLVLAGQRVMDPRAYQLEGTIARVSVSIPAGGTGEIVFDKAGARRGEGAQSIGGRPIGHDEEVVIVDYQRGLALVQPWAEFMAGAKPESAAADSATGSERAPREAGASGRE